MSDSHENSLKKSKPWSEIRSETKRYKERKQEEKEAERALKDFQRHLEQDDPPYQ